MSDNVKSGKAILEALYMQRNAIYAEHGFMPECQIILTGRDYATVLRDMNPNNFVPLDPVRRTCFGHPYAVYEAGRSFVRRL